MTRQHNQQFHCPNCRTWLTSETLFGRWIRNNPKLDSSSGFSIVDCDYWVHRFRTHEGREFQCIMLVEVKTCGADLSAAQRDTLMIVNQITRNRRETPTKARRFEAGTGVLKAYSAMLGREVFVKAFGVHKLRFSGLGPEDSEFISWDDKAIEPDTLTKLLRFDLDPDSLRDLDLRSHHRKLGTERLLFSP